ncbi:Hypothetical predicted protein [Mytilus galloprovincialis]|uniref:Uncharacterized protein n=1 Tax=Mytilus galloprovincialis TaxID=29158 RepID=A0A8B6D2W6_MYTGA|nr:Hypothetical predicted protein [Mytilus galloprovincialis]
MVRTSYCIHLPSNTSASSSVDFPNTSSFLEQQPKHENIAINSVKIPDPHDSDNGNETNDADRAQPLLSVHCHLEAICLPRLERSISENTHSSSPRECPNLTTSTTNFAPTHGEDFRSTSNNDQCEDLLQRCEKLYESNLKKEHNIDSDKKCTVGSMVMTSDNQLLIVDKENNRLKVLDEANMWHDINEPKSKYIRITPLYKNFIAAIFSDEGKIQYIQISADKMVYTGKEIDLKTLGKSVCCFNIAYSKNHFAVRIELGLKGRFVILNTDGDILHIFWNSKRRFGECNENSVEIALSYSERCIFISSFDRNAVYCVNFNGHTRWSTPVSCPKGILYVSNTDLLCQQNIILACQSPNVIYQIDSKSGKLTLLIEEKDGINVTNCIGYKETETEYLLYTDSNTGNIFEFSLTAKNLET